MSDLVLGFISVCFMVVGWIEARFAMNNNVLQSRFDNRYANRDEVKTDIMDLERTTNKVMNNLNVQMSEMRGDIKLLLSKMEANR